MNVEYISGKAELLERVRPLWQKLSAHHHEHSKDFKEHFEKMTFDIRRESFLQKAKNGDLLVVLASAEGKDVGFCVSTVDEHKIGEVESLYLETNYRKMGIGERLLGDSLKWLDTSKAKRKIIGVAAGNEEVLPFYEKFGFKIRTLILQQK